MTEEERIGVAYQRLIKTYLASPHRKKVDLIDRAYKFARQAHEGVRRISGEPYIMHPLAVAQIVSEELGLGSTMLPRSRCASRGCTGGRSSRPTGAR